MTAKSPKSIKINSPGQDAVYAVEQAYRSYFDKLFSYARVICDSEEMAKDVVSDFFFGLLKNQVDFDHVDNLEVYLLVGVKNLCIQKLKKQSLPDEQSILLATVDYIDPQEVLLGNELKKVLNRAINELPDQCQLIFRMSKERGMSNKEISEELGIGPGTVKTQLSRAQSKLKDSIVEHYKDDDTSASHLQIVSQLLLLVSMI